MPDVCLLGMPCNDRGMNPGVAGAFYAARWSGRVVERSFGSGSLLARNFNALWCHGLNLKRCGEPVTRFAMLHDDVGPTESDWLDTLLNELDAGGFDVLSVAVPLKDSRGLTSCGLGDGRTWEPVCRFTTTELARMPTTFTAADIGHPDKTLLVNTGCWACRFDADWVERICFTVRDQIWLNPATNRYEARVESEDWNASRQFARLGLKVGVTRAVKLRHYGATAYPNDAVWGEPFDSTLTDRSLIRE